ncbi:MAG TPA: RNA 2',3'-cyclic phosphodiesterase [Thermoplasmata archaeon]|nr:RNA 2',3'-cyclic phosphodiesterase [Thermoplasmata archaeon]
MRAFVAVDVPSSATDRSAPTHLTLRFLGEVPPERVPFIADRLGDVARAVAPFDLTLEGVGAFPSARNPRIVWVGVTVGREAVIALAERVRASLASEGSATEEGPFVPHVTLFRVRAPAGLRAARALLDGRVPGPEPRSFRVEAVLLKESRLRPGGADHRTVAAFALGGGAVEARGSGVDRSATSFRQR